MRSLAPRLLRRPLQHRLASGSLPAFQSCLWPAAPSVSSKLPVPHFAAGWRGLAAQAGEADAKADENAEKAGGEGEAKKAAGEEHDEVEKQKGKEEAEDSEAKAKEAAAKPEEPKASPKELLEKEIADLEAKLKSQKHTLLMALADFENSKKSRLKERESRRRKATIKFAQKMVEVYADFDKVARQKGEGELSDVCKGLNEGVEMVRDLYRTTLERFDVVPLTAEKGDSFVAARHEEVGQVEGALEVPVNGIVEVVKPGWILEPTTPHAVVLAKAHVKTARHGPEVPPAPPSS